MKKYWLLFGFIFIANFVFADCFIEGSPCFLNLETGKVKELLGLTAEETSDSDAYKEVISHLKDRYALDIEKDIRNISFYLFPGRRSNDYIVVVNGTFDSEKIQNLVKNLIESEKWRYHKIENVEIGGNKYSLFNIQGFLNILFYDKNNIILSNDFILNNKSIKFSNAPASINKISQITNNYLYAGKDIFPILKMLFKISDIELEKATSLLCYIKDDKVFLDVNFNDTASPKEVLSKIENLSKEQVEKYKQNLNDNLDKIKKELADIKENIAPSIFENIFNSFFYSRTSDLINILDFKQIDNSIVVSTDFSWNYIISTLFTIIYQQNRR